MRVALQTADTKLQAWFAKSVVVILEVWPESQWPGFALRQADVLQLHTA